MTKYLMICGLLITTLFACQSENENNAQQALTPPPPKAESGISEHAKREKDLLEKEKELLRKEIALAKKESAMHAAQNKPQETKAEKAEAELAVIDIAENVAKSIIYCENKKYFIRVDELTNGKTRYTSWNKPKTTKHTPDLMLFDPIIDYLDEFGPRYIFYNKGWSYIIEHGEKTEYVDESVYIRLWKDDKEHYYSKMNIL